LGDVRPIGGGDVRPPSGTAGVAVQTPIRPLRRLLE
jgi:hypothetical protein